MKLKELPRFLAISTLNHVILGILMHGFNIDSPPNICLVPCLLSTTPKNTGRTAFVVDRGTFLGPDFVRIGASDMQIAFHMHLIGLL